MKSYCLKVTYKCNRNCSYCMVDTHNISHPEHTFENIKAKIEAMDDGSEVAITGGEPGLVSREIIEYCMIELTKKNCEICMLTNGTYFEKYTDEYDKYITSYVWHVSSDLELVKLTMPKNIDPDKIERILIIDDVNVKKLDEFVELNPFINKLSSADPVEVNGKMGTSLSKINAIRLVQKYKNTHLSDSVNQLLHSFTTFQQKYDENAVLTIIH
jgi:organic radical activating enzyme